jgi:hypothetical protein
MATFQILVRKLRRAEHVLDKQLAGIRQAIASLEFGGAASPPTPRRESRRSRPARRRRKMSAKARKAISDAQKRRWAKRKAAKS